MLVKWAPGDSYIIEYPSELYLNRNTCEIPFVHVLNC